MDTSDNNPEILPPHQLLVSDEYWQGPITKPSMGFAALNALFQENEAKQIELDTKAAKEIGSRVLSAAGGGEVIKRFEEGEKLTPPDPDSRQFIKAVKDTCTVLKPLNQFAYSRRSFRQTRDIESFDREAKIMERDDVIYTGEPISMMSEFAVFSHLHVEREILYLRGAEDNNFLVALRSKHAEESLKSSPRFDCKVKPQHPFRVGKLYSTGDLILEKVTKIPSAALIEPHGVAWTHHKKQRPNSRRLERNPSLGLLPRIQFGTK